ncbi:MAG: iron chelate uptake ABC transporter family permease subunit [Bacillota bacterium]
MEQINRKIPVVLLAVILAITIVAATGAGAVAIPAKEIITVLVRKLPLVGNHVDPSAPPVHETIIMVVRLPRVVLAAFVGAALSAAGVVLQALFRNPLADPYLIGASSGAALGGCLSILIYPGFLTGDFGALPVLAFGGALGAMAIVFGLARIGNRVAIGALILAGIAVGSFLSAVVSLLIFTSGDRLHPLVYWLMGSFSARNWGHVTMALPYITVALVVLLLFTRELNALLLGEESARYLGVEVETVKKLLLAAATLLTAASVAAAGPIGFVGLVVPHIMRLFLGPDHRLLLPGAVLAGAAFLVGADLLARLVMAPGEIPVGIVTAVCGGPFFAYLLWRRRIEI